MKLSTHTLLGIGMVGWSFASAAATAADPSDPAPSDPQPAAAAPAAASEPSRFHLTLGADVTSAYFFRGIRQEDSGFILQPYADLAMDVYRSDNATLSVKAGMWSSFHGESTAAATTDNFTKRWYECDLYAGVGLVTGKWSFDLRYTALTSPSDAFGTVDEIDFSVTFDDSELLGAWSLKPTAMLVVEVGSNATDGARNGTYLQLGVSPGFTFDEGCLKDVSLTFPVTVGLSLGNYYESGDGENDAFGFASVGAKAAVPLKLDPSWGAWTLTAGVQALFLGDAARDFNEDHGTEFIGTIGVSVSF